MGRETFFYHESLYSLFQREKRKPSCDGHELSNDAFPLKVTFRRGQLDCHH